MIADLRRQVNIHFAMGAIVPKIFMTYRSWFWIGMVLNAITLALFVFFWRAVYENTETIAGMNLQQTINYVLLARLFAPLIDIFALWEIGYNLREGGIATALLRPVDMQASYYLQGLVNTMMFLLWQIPTAIMATLVFGLQWPTDLRVWGAFLISAVLGRTIFFFFDWLLASLTFYTTEVWGLGVLMDGIALFLSGTLVPLIMMPGWLQTIARFSPFSQGLYAPLSILTGIVPMSQVGQVWLVQIAWVIGMGLFSRLVFQFAVRKVTVQGG